MEGPRDSEERRVETIRLLEESGNLVSDGKHAEAESVLLGIIADSPEETQALVGLGIIALETGRPDLAAQRMSQALSIDSKCVPALCWMSFLLRENNQLDMAKRCASYAATLAPYNAAAHLALARCLVRLDLHSDAVLSFQRAVQLHPIDPVPMFELADELIAVGLDREAAETLRRAVALAPDIAGNLKLASLELTLGRIEDAETYCKWAVDRNPQLAVAQALMGRILTEQLRFDEAEVHWKLAEKLDPRTGAFNLEKGLALNFVGRFEEALTELKCSIEAKPNQGGAYQALAYAKKVGPEDGPIVRQMESVLSRGTLPPNELLGLLYALGKSFDDLGNYEKAIGYFDRANEVHRQILGSRHFDREAFKELMDEKIRLFTKELFQTSRDIGSHSSLPILVIGMMRSGTSLAEQLLACHPQVWGAGERYFWVDHDTEAIDYAQQSIRPSNIQSCAAEYLELLTSLGPGFPYVIDKNPVNILFLGAIHLAFPNARIIHTRRSAVDTALSIWTTPLRTDAPFICDRGNIAFAYKEYLRLMDHWRSVLPADRFLEVQYEDLVSDPEVHIRRMVDFCGLEWDDACLHPEKKPRRVNTPSLWQVRQPIYKSSKERWRKYEPWLGAFEELRGLG